MNCDISNVPVKKECMKPEVKKRVVKRRFLGKTENFADKQERNYFKKMLKAYLRGNTHFSFGRDSETRQPIMHKVLQEYYEPKVIN